jgi:peptide/nickel transport system ATP-binding protein
MTLDEAPVAGAVPLLSIQNLSVTYRSRQRDVMAVRNVSMEILRGQTVAVVGESGSGKSTIAAAVDRLLPANGHISGGVVLFEGLDLARASEREMIAIRGAEIGFVPQDPMTNLDPLMRVGDQIGEALEVHGRTTGKATRRRVIELLEMVGIPDPTRRINQYPHEYSGGMRQRALIAIGLACGPKLLIADEPTSSLDVTVQRRILDRLETLTAELGTAVFLISHNLGLAAERADRIVVMHHGEVVEAGAASEILAHPQDEYTQRLLAAAPSLSSGTRVMYQRRTVGDSSDADPKPAADNLVEVRDLRKVFTIRGAGRDPASQFTAVDGVSFDIPRGQTVSIVGESGAGKSTIANLLLGLEEITSGHITYDGADLDSLDRRELFAFRRRVQPVFQNPYASLDPRYSIAESIVEPLRVHHLGTATSRTAIVTRLLDQVSLPSSAAQRFPHELSGGEQQRVAIARALVLSPELIILDEAVSALDVLVQAQILELIAELQEKLNLSYLFISHDLAVVSMISHRMYVMERGKFVESGTPREIFEHPQVEYTRELLAAIPGSGIAASARG